MTALEKMEELYRNEIKPSSRLLLLAYVQLHLENPGLHPDDALCVDGGYMGFHAVLVHDVLTRFKDIPNSLQYPCSLIRLPIILHDPIVEDYEEEVTAIRSFMLYPETGDINPIINDLQQLYLRIADEERSAEEEELTTAGIIRECADILLWIARQA